MANKGIINTVLSISPSIEITVRKIYWNNFRIFSKLKRKGNSFGSTNASVDFNRIIDKLKSVGIGEGDLMILHSSYDVLEKTHLSPKQIIDKLLALLGNSGTLAMNSARRFKEERPAEYLSQDFTNIVTKYDLRKSKVWTGAIPFCFLRYPGIEISEFPINPMIAKGKLAKEMMENNLKGDLKPCGEGSSWEFCVNHNAVIVGLGIDLTHSLTIMHVAEDANSNWPHENWYRERKFEIVINDNLKKEIKVFERRPKWGTLHFAERTLCRDLITNRILKVVNVDGIPLEYVYAKDLVHFLNSRNHNGYPYFGVKRKDRYDK